MFSVYLFIAWCLAPSLQSALHFICMYLCFRVASRWPPQLVRSLHRTPYVVAAVQLALAIALAVVDSRHRAPPPYPQRTGVGIPWVGEEGPSKHCIMYRSYGMPAFVLQYVVYSETVWWHMMTNMFGYVWCYKSEPCNTSRKRMVPRGRFSSAALCHRPWGKKHYPCPHDDVEFNRTIEKRQNRRQIRKQIQHASFCICICLKLMHRNWLFPLHRTGCWPKLLELQKSLLC